MWQGPVEPALLVLCVSTARRAGPVKSQPHLSIAVDLAIRNPFQIQPFSGTGDHWLGQNFHWTSLCVWTCGFAIRLPFVHGCLGFAQCNQHPTSNQWINQDQSKTRSIMVQFASQCETQGVSQKQASAVRKEKSESQEQTSTAASSTTKWTAKEIFGCTFHNTTQMKKGTQNENKHLYWWSQNFIHKAT